MADVEELVKALRFPQDKVAHGALKELTALSQVSPQVYPFFDDFCAMLEDSNSYVRNRGLALIAQNARWDRSGKLDRALDAYLAHVMDEKPITARQCIQNLSHILQAKPELAPRIRAALAAADFSRCADSMSPLLERDRIKILKQISAVH